VVWSPSVDFVLYIFVITQGSFVTTITNCLYHVLLVEYVHDVSNVDVLYVKFAMNYTSTANDVLVCNQGVDVYSVFNRSDNS